MIATKKLLLNFIPPVFLAGAAELNFLSQEAAQNINIHPCLIFFMNWLPTFLAGGKLSA
ncbi:MAG: hypothetical protein ACUVRL_04380 [Candidatus Saccharicenans sp.]